MTHHMQDPKRKKRALLKKLTTTASGKFSIGGRPHKVKPVSLPKIGKDK